MAGLSALQGRFGRGLGTGLDFDGLLGGLGFVEGVVFLGNGTHGGVLLGLQAGLVLGRVVGGLLGLGLMGAIFHGRLLHQRLMSAIFHTGLLH